MTEQLRGSVLAVKLPIPLDAMETINECVRRVYGTGNTRVSMDGDQFQVIAPEEGFGPRERGRGRLPSASNDAMRLRFAAVRNGTAKLTIEDQQYTIAYIAEIAKRWFTEVGGINYVEVKLAVGDAEPDYVFVMQRLGGQTPHEMREAAEVERDAALSRIARVEALHQRIGASWPHNGGVYVCQADGGIWPCPTVRALTEGEPDAG